ncbi:sugar-binding domain-containing protein [Scatolibacter rhodanostii]|uniref:sugar-binding domain-containing protein n=1 Tax=Scatolibacter rhodanostii TaxID=2014781 RepID=UPI000C085192|nr:sugar-binding domain-containing protein [Scatolibacter rhodanostii]
MERINLAGQWDFLLDSEKVGIDKAYYQKELADKIILPATVSSAQKGTPNEDKNIGHLTDPYFFEGYTWYAKQIDFEEVEDKEYFLHLERTRISHVWVDNRYVGSCGSLCTSHEYALTPYLTEKQHRITIMVDNTSYLVKGGHMTSPDTQTNWNGITGAVYVEVREKRHLTDIKIVSSWKDKKITARVIFTGPGKKILTAYLKDEEKQFSAQTYELFAGENILTYDLEDTIIGWSEHTPKLYNLVLAFSETDQYSFTIGIRDFKATQKYFEINGQRTFLRGKHDGLIFPLTGYAPTDLESWLKVMGTAKEYGINHYRFHTCCPPEAAFCAADQLGIYMEPELPFWGTITEEGDENHDAAAQEYLIEEGYRIMDEFGNHPSFVMMSLGNELWGSRERLNQILGEYKAYDDRHLYTQGSNNFQFVPCLLENEDFFCGVRLSKDRLFRGSYAMCDAPQGHIQTDRPNSTHCYDEMIRPNQVSENSGNAGEITIQYGTGTKTVQADAAEEFIPNAPVVSHEIGQFAMYPDFSEIKDYTGVLKARNFEVFRERLEKTGMLDMAEIFFKASGKLAIDCYKAELETALRSNELAGFQILDLQDFSGQGTALIGVLNALMESKGIVEPREWREFCADVVLSAEFSKFVYQSGETVLIGCKLANFSAQTIKNPSVKIVVFSGEKEILTARTTTAGEYTNEVCALDNIQIQLPEVENPTKLHIKVEIEGTAVTNQYDLWVYPHLSERKSQEVIVTTDLCEAIQQLSQGEKVLFYPTTLDEKNSIEGTYCTDFWCYPMFRSISESMNKPIPVGTLGLVIENHHPAFSSFPTEFYTTPQWYDVVSHSRALVLDSTDIRPLVWSVDNFERNHKLGNLWEANVGKGKLFVCTANLSNLKESAPAQWLEKSIIDYMNTNGFEPTQSINAQMLKDIFN